MINKKEFEEEGRKLKGTKTKVLKKKNRLEDEKKKFEEKVSNLTKNTSSYSVELEIAKNMLTKNSTNIEKVNTMLSNPYFARVDFVEEGKKEEQIYFGKFGLFDKENMEEAIVDWRAPVADLYYSGTEGKASYEAPAGKYEGELKLKRKFLIEEGSLKNAFDEGINQIIIKAGLEEDELIDEFLKINLESTSGSKLKDVVATIQKEQNKIIRMDMNKPIIIQGSAGSGKTTVALHRLAYLVYRYNKTVKSENILVIAPNKIFLNYIADVLPNLGADEVVQVTFNDIVRNEFKHNIDVINKDKKLDFVLCTKDINNKKLLINGSKLKGLPVFKTILDRYLRMIQIEDILIEDVKVDDYTIYKKSAIAKLYAKDLSYLPMNKRKEEIQRYMNGRLESKMVFIKEEIDFDYYEKINELKNNMEDDEKRREKIIQLYDDRDKYKKDFKRKATKKIKEFVANWKTVNIINLYHKLYIDEEISKSVFEGKIPPILKEYLKNKHLELAKENKIESEDLAALLYLKIKIDGIKNKNTVKHIVIDEAQDYSLFDMMVIKELYKCNSMTVVGDIGQGIYSYKGELDWQALNKYVFENKSDFIQLTKSYRSTVEIIEFANKVLTKQKIKYAAATPVLRHGNKPKLIQINEKQNIDLIIDRLIQEIEQENEKYVAIICKSFQDTKILYDYLKDASKCDWTLIEDNENEINNNKIIIPAYKTKGLEFDCSIVYDCSFNKYTDNELDKKLLYVALTRALHSEFILYKDKISELLV